MTPRLFRADSTFGTETSPKASARTTVQVTDAHGRPPEPVDKDASIVTLSHEETTAAVVKKTLGIKATSGTWMVADCPDATS